MNESEYAERLEQYRLQIERLIEIGEARDARYEALRAEVKKLRSQYDHLQRYAIFIAARANTA